MLTTRAALPQPHAAPLLPAQVRLWARLAQAAVERDRAALDQINVFPVADGDTGTNMYLTLRAGARAVTESKSSTAPVLLGEYARGALLGARGNSGTILSEWLRGIALAVAQHQSMPLALSAAAALAQEAVARPAPGTILTAAQEAAHLAATAGEDASAALTQAVAGARSGALASPRLLPHLAQAGVLDAGACALVLVLGALQVAVCEPEAAPFDRLLDQVTLELRLSAEHPGAAEGNQQPQPLAAASVAIWEGEATSEADEFEVMFLVARTSGALASEPTAGERIVSSSASGKPRVVASLASQSSASEPTAERLREELGKIGTSVAVVGGAGLWQTHVHTPELEGPIAVARRWAAVPQCAVERCLVRHLTVPESDLTILTSTAAPGLAAEFARAGAVVVVPLGHPTSVAELAALAVEASASQAVVLANQPSQARAPDGIVVLSSPTDGHTALALAALAEDPNPTAAARALARAQVRPVTLTGLARELSDGAAVEPPMLLVASAAVPAVEQLLARQRSEVVLVPTGLPGDDVVLASEAVDS